MNLNSDHNINVDIETKTDLEHENLELYSNIMRCSLSTVKNLTDNYCEQFILIEYQQVIILVIINV